MDGPQDMNPRVDSSSIELHFIFLMIRFTSTHTCRMMTKSSRLIIVQPLSSWRDEMTIKYICPEYVYLLIKTEICYIYRSAYWNTESRSFNIMACNNLPLLTSKKIIKIKSFLRAISHITYPLILWNSFIQFHFSNVM